MASLVSIEQVQSMYIAYYGRPADPVGLAWWADRLDQCGGDLAAILDAFGNSAEYRDRFDGLDNAEIIDRFYQQVFNRNADAEGLAYYLGELTAGRMTLASIAKNIWDGAINDDAGVVRDKLDAAAYFTARIAAENKLYGSASIPEVVVVLSEAGVAGTTVDQVQSSIDSLIGRLEDLGAAEVEVTAPTWVLEGETAVVEVRVGEHVQPVQIAWRTEPIDAITGADFVAGEGVLVFGLDDEEARIELLTLADHLVEGSESFRLVLEPLVNAQLPGGGAATRTIEIRDHAASAVEPTAAEQLLLELINRARLDPEAEARLVGIPHIHEGLKPGTLTSGPRQPLGFDPDLSLAAREHAVWMLESDQFSHLGFEASSPGDRITAAGYQWRTYGENLAWKGSTDGIPDLAQWIENLHAALFADLSVPDRGHRVNILNGSFREVGLAVLTGVFTTGTVDYDALMITNDYGTRVSDLDILTGVIFEDRDGDGFYSLGEGLGGVRIDATGPGGVYTTWSLTAGGYQMELPPGDYDVRFSAPELGDLTGEVTLAGLNEKLDWIL